MSRRINAFQSALIRLAHPLAILAAVVLLVNALVLQPLWPSWWTGKIGDLAWLAFVPLLLASALAFLSPSLMMPNPARMGFLAIALTGLGFAAVKTIAPLNTLLNNVAASYFNFPLKLTLDPTDLLALPGLLVAWYVWSRPAALRPPMRVRYLALTLAALAVLADSAAPQDLGPTCLAQNGEVLYATASRNTYTSVDTKVTKSVYRSDDGGLSWTYESTRTESLSTGNTSTPTPAPDAPASAHCLPAAWPVNDPSDAKVQYYAIDGKGIYRSEDGGANLKLEIEVQKTYGVVLDSRTGNLIVAAGEDGVLTRTPDGEWQTTQLTVQTP
jgi:hypothetical protein